MATNQAVCDAVVLPAAWMSHMIQLIEFAKRLVSQHSNFHVTCIIPGNGPPSQATKVIVEALPTSIDATFLPPVSFDDLADVPTPSLKIFATVARSLPSLRNVLESLLSKTQLCAFLTNIFGIDSLDAAQEFNIPTYIFEQLRVCRCSRSCRSWTRQLHASSKTCPNRFRSPVGCRSMRKIFQRRFMTEKATCTRSFSHREVGQFPRWDCD